MAVEKRRCAACGRWFDPYPHVSNQQYCSARPCQRERKRRWQAERLRSDPDYRHNQADAQRRWCEAHPDYWRKYRAAHPEYVEQNRTRQQERNRRGRLVLRIDSPQGLDACGDCKDGRVDGLTCPLSSGTYRLIPASSGAIAKMDACLVRIDVISRGCEHTCDLG